ncbi:MAG: bifunctional DNA-formamidopyrimidine glycosylase/DNA-(apurinic or apyrimidinic site) lyase [Deltaproteobacteria bacterium]|nr:bifunctional DNA-formamidopyrimidine glycosylase/DNA-(apurinic or apyrimidinic site) lyase [Deltaproteobacteria bacterium]
MPELPEVETVVRQLSPHLQGKTLAGVRLFDDKLRHFPSRKLSGLAFERVQRVGKLVVFGGPTPQGERFVGVHLRMTGRLLWHPAGMRAERRHLRARFSLREGGAVLFYDARRFGTLQLATSWEELESTALDPTSAAFAPQRLGKLLAQGGGQSLKVWLMRQDRLVGLGNIYASEILFRARLHPYRITHSLTRDEIVRLHQSTQEVLAAAIEACGTTFSDFQTAHGFTGSYQRYLQVYGREGEPCLVCGCKIERVVQAQRSSFFCPGCQVA